jgi:hypothetical protein
VTGAAAHTLEQGHRSFLLCRSNCTPVFWAVQCAAADVLKLLILANADLRAHHG